MHSKTTVESLFIINPKAPATALYDAAHERLTKIKAITNYMLADCSDGDPSVSGAAQCDALWLIDGLVDEAEQLILQTHHHSELKTTIHPDTTHNEPQKQ